MDSSIEYQIFIGVHDFQSNDTTVMEQEFIDMVTEFFTRKKIDFTLLRARGGYSYEKGKYITENALCINIIGDPGFDIVKFARSLSMYMNQECSLIIKNPVNAVFV